MRTVKIHGKDYETVGSRVDRYIKDNPSHSITTDLVKYDDLVVIMKATIKDENDRTLSTGYAFEKEGSTMINKTSALENCETSAVGRALAIRGYAGTEFASAEEVGNAVVQQKEITEKEKLLTELNIVFNDKYALVPENTKEIAKMYGCAKKSDFVKLPVEKIKTLLKSLVAIKDPTDDIPTNEEIANMTVHEGGLL